MEDREDKAIVEAYERQLRQDHGMGSGDEEQDWEEQDWEKPTNPFTIKKQFGKVHENISIFYKKTPTYNPQMSKRENVTNPKPMKGDLNIDETNVISGVYKHSEDYDPYLVYPISVQKFRRL